jgi:hypothetical protein
MSSQLGFSDGTGTSEDVSGRVSGNGQVFLYAWGGFEEQGNGRCPELEVNNNGDGSGAGRESQCTTTTMVAESPTITASCLV